MNGIKKLLLMPLCFVVALSGCAAMQDEGAQDRQAGAERAAAAGKADGKQTQEPRGAASDADPAGATHAPPAERPALVAAGTGKFIKDARWTPHSFAKAGPDGEVTLNYVNADVRQVLRDVLGDILHVDYVVDPKVQGTVTVNTGHPLQRKAVLPVLEAVLRTSGLAVAQNGDVFRIFPLDDSARNSPVVLSPGPARPGYGLRIFPLKFTSATQLRQVLEPYAPPGGVIEADGARNLLIVSGTRQDLDGLGEIINLFDVDWIKGMSYAIYPLQVGRPRSIAAELDGIFGDTSSGPLAGLVRIVPLERLNSILVISTQPAYLREVKTWIDRLDYGDDETTPRLFHYAVQNSRAADLAEVLNDLLSSGDVKTVQPRTAPGTTGVELSPRPSGSGSGSVSFGLGASSASAPSAPASPGLMVSGSVPSPTLAAASTGASAGSFGTGSIGRGPARAGTSAPRPQSRRLLPRDGFGEDDFEVPQARVVADEKNNALVIFARPKDYRMIEDVLKKLDVVPLQVLIEATIAEVTLNDKLQYGLQYFLKSGQSQLTLTESNTLGVLAGVLPGFSYVLGGTSAQAILSALSSLSDVNVISSPQLLVLDHQTAALQVGDQVPVVTQQAVSVLTPGAPVVNSIEFRDTGVILQVTPRVNANGLVTLDIAQEVSDVVPTTTSGIDSPTIQQRKIVSSVVVQDGETIALGGLIRDGQTKTRSGIPFLSEIPVAGALFSNTNTTKSRTELLVLLSPKVIRNVQEAREMTDELRNRMQALKPIDLRIK